jgi:hypothetical protein
MNFVEPDVTAEADLDERVEETVSTVFAVA